MTDNGTDSVPIPRDVVHDRTLSHRAYRVYGILKDLAWTLRLAQATTYGDLSVRDMPLDELLVLVGCGQSQLYQHLSDLQARHHLDFYSAGRIVTITFPEPKVVTMPHLPASPAPVNAAANGTGQPGAIPEKPESGSPHGGGGSPIEEDLDINHHHHVRKNRNDSGKAGMAGLAGSPAPLADPGDDVALQDAADMAVQQLLVETPLVAGCDPVWSGPARRFISRNGARNVLAWFMWYRNPQHQKGLRQTPVHALSRMLGKRETPSAAYLPPQLCENCGRIEAYCTCPTPALFTPVEIYVAAAQYDPHMVAFTNPWGICPTCHGLYDLSCTCEDDRAGAEPLAGSAPEPSGGPGADPGAPGAETADGPDLSEEYSEWRVREIAETPQTGGVDSATDVTATGDLAVPAAPASPTGVSYLLPVTLKTEISPASEIWSATREHLSMQMTRATFDTWVKHSSGLDYADGVFVVGLPSGYAKDWLENTQHTTIKRTLGYVLGNAVEVRYIVVPSDSGGSGSPGYFRGQCVRQPAYGIGVVQTVVPTERGAMEVVVQFSDKIKRFETLRPSP